jgi:hypothetical protein
MYGNDNFKHMLDFMLSQKDKRPTWYYPETSYFIGLDIDAPLFLTEYLRSRAMDLSFITENNIEGVLNFSTGQENGYWLFDWTAALLTNSEHNFDPLIGIKLLGLSSDFWQRYMDYQKRFFTDERLISILSFSNFGEEVFPEHKILERNLLKELRSNSLLLKKEIFALEEALYAAPEMPTENFRNRELLLQVKITQDRILHAMFVRRALLHRTDEKIKDRFIEKARKVRASAQLKMKQFMKEYSRYPGSFVYKSFKNPTSYNYGYGYPSSNLFFWQREEKMVKFDIMHPFYMNIYDFIDIIF